MGVILKPDGKTFYDVEMEMFSRIGPMIDRMVKAQEERDEKWKAWLRVQELRKSCGALEGKTIKFRRYGGLDVPENKG